MVTFARSKVTAERLSACVVGFGAGITSSLLSCWAPLSLVGRAVVFFGSAASGFFLARWAGRASTPGRGFAKALLAGAVQANISSAALVVLAMLVDSMLDIAPVPNHFGDVTALFFIMAIAGSFVGAVVGFLYGFVPAYVVAAREERSHATLDRVMIANAAWLVIIGIAHALVISRFHEPSIPLSTENAALVAAAWSAPIVLGITLFTFARMRARHRTAFVERVREGREALYRIVPIAALASPTLVEDLLPIDNDLPRVLRRSALVRISEPSRERSYRENASPIEPTEVLALV